MLVPWRALNGRHLSAAQCARGVDQKRRRLEEEELWEISERFFQAYGAPLENVMMFKYMGRLMTAGDDDWSAVTGKIQKSRKSWGCMSRILIREGADPKVSYHFFKSVVQLVLLFKAEMWILTPRMERTLSIFQHRSVRHLIRIQPRRRGGGELGLSSSGYVNGRSGL